MAWLLSTAYPLPAHLLDPGDAVARPRTGLSSPVFYEALAGSSGENRSLTGCESFLGFQIPHQRRYNCLKGKSSILK